MTFLDYFGILITVVLAGGMIWAVVDLMVKIHRQPKKSGPVDLTRLSPYPFVPELVDTKDPKAHSYPRELYRYK